MNEWLMMMEKRFVLYWFFHGMSNNRGRRDIDNGSIFYIWCSSSIYTKKLLDELASKIYGVGGNFFLVFFFDFVRIWLIDEIRFSQSFRQWFCSKMPVLCSHAWEGTLAHCSKNLFFVQKFKLCKNLQKNYFDIFNSFCIKNDNFFLDFSM